MDKETVERIQASGVELGAELEAEVREAASAETPATDAVTPTISEVEQRLNAVTQEAPEVVEPEKAKEATTEDPTDEMSKVWDSLSPDNKFEIKQDPLELPETPEAQRFANDFKQYLGFDVSELRDGVQSFKQMQKEIETYRAQKTVDKQLGELRTEWKLDGAEFDGRMEKVVERFGKLPAGERGKFDGIEGAKFIWARIEQEERAQSNKAQNVPTFERSRSKTEPGSKAIFTQADIDSMSMEVYERNADKIAYAYQNGLVKK